MTSSKIDKFQVGIGISMIILAAIVVLVVLNEIYDWGGDPCVIFVGGISISAIIFGIGTIIYSCYEYGHM